MPFNPETKKIGDLVKSQDWNEATTEIVRLEKDKVNRSGNDTIKGPLTITGNFSATAGEFTGSLSVAGKVSIGMGTPTTLHVRDELCIGSIEDGKKFVLRSPVGGDGTFIEITYDKQVNGQWTWAFTEGITLTRTGNVGIGTRDPKAKLHVSGNAVISGNVGIGKTDPKAKLDISSADRTGNHPTNIKGLYITGDFKADSDGVEFRKSDATEGIGFGLNTIYAAGSSANQDLGLKAKGTGQVKVTGNLSVTGNLTVSGKVNDRDIAADGLKLDSHTHNGTNSNKVKHSDLDLTGAGTNPHGTTADNVGALSISGGTVNGNISVSGNVGIGTTDPKAKLDVKGDVNAGNLGVSGSISAIGSNPNQDLVLQAKGSGQVKVSSPLSVTGNVGIGTDASNANLDVKGNVSVSGSVNFGSKVRQMLTLYSTNTSGDNYGIGVQVGTQYFRTSANFAWYKGGSHNDGVLNAGTGGTTLMTLDTNGTLNVTGTIKVNGQEIGANALPITGGTVTGNLSVRGKVGIGVTTPDIDALPKIHLAIGDDDTGLQQQGDGELAIYTDAVERVRVNKKGNVGIGTKTFDRETTKLKVNGDIVLGKDAKNTRFIFHTRGDNNGDYLLITHDNTELINYWEWNQGITLKRGGNVGIGRNNPQAKLDVNGDVNAVNLGVSGSISAIGNDAIRDLVLQGKGTTGQVKVSSPLSVTGNVGIGVMTPSIGTLPTIHLAIGDHDTGLKQQGDGELAIYTDNVERVRVNKQGNVGIGTTAPKAKLDVNGDVNAVNLGVSGSISAIGNDTNRDLVLKGKGTGNVNVNSGSLSFGSRTGQLINLWDIKYGIGIQQATQYFRTDGNFAWYKGGSHSSNTAFDPGTNPGSNPPTQGTTLMVLDADGNLRIGSINNTARGKVDIEGSVGYTDSRGYRYWNVGMSNVSDPIGAYFAKYSLYASDFIGCKEVNVFSDLRIKEIKGTSDSQADLQTLLRIQVTDYHYKDKIANGNRPKKKVIGQQIADVYPQAVSTHVDVVPDIFESAIIEENWVTLNSHNLKTEDKVKIFWNDDDSQLFTVEAIEPDKFKIPLDHTGDIFVYGREVDDFHVVDYDALSMLHISATQELYKIIKKLEEKINEKVKG
ncbi:hypothetical protein [Microcystis aeruginosa]|uniref:beta strand repeat-containing protein n=1 Tax=Microcystis aeruginosa TaxID=1126 RepID=UPI0021AB49BC|nr:hypothetical protein [Microcystis aeruginosa]